MSSMQPGHLQEDESTRRISDMSLVELGEKLFQWRDYTAIPIFMFILLIASPSARTATIGTLLILAGEGIRVYTVGFLGQTANERDAQSEFVISHGPYALIRNPLYVGNMVVILGVLIYAGTPIVGLLALVFFGFQYHCVVKYEESFMLAKFGEEYQRYMERVPAWIPIKVPMVEDFPVPPSITAAIKMERKSITVMGIILFLLMLASK